MKNKTKTKTAEDSHNPYFIVSMISIIQVICRYALPKCNPTQTALTAITYLR